MAGKYDDLASQIVELAGGKSNVKCVAHCITAFVLSPGGRVEGQRRGNLSAAQRHEVMRANGQYQVVVGQHRRGRLRCRPQGRRF